MKDNIKELKLEEMETVSGGLFRLRENPKNKEKWIPPAK